MREIFSSGLASRLLKRTTAMFGLPLLSMLLGVTLPCFAEEMVEIQSVDTGFYWDFPIDAAPAENSGAFYMDQWPDREYISLAGATMSWAEMNPREGEYDFSRLQELLTEAETRNTPLIIRLKCHVVYRITPGDWGGPDLPYVPQWVLDKHNPACFFTTGDSSGSRAIQVAAPWNAGLQQELKAFIEAFGAMFFFENQYLRGVYITGFASSFGEEFWLHRDYLQNALDAGMTEELLRQTYLDRMDWWVAAAQSKVNKLIWIDYGEIQNSGYNLDTLDNYAMSLGLGWRHGGPDTYHTPQPSEAGQSYDAASGYITTDYTYPFRDGNRCFAGEIEVVLASVDTQQIHLTESAIMRTAQIGMNYVWTSPAFIDYAPEMFKWWTISGGWGPAQAPDAICWLREDYLRSGELDYEWKNFERFLYQRDFPGALTLPVLPIPRPESLFWQDQPGRHYDNSARSTDVEGGSTAMLFFMDQEFKRNLEHPFHVAVTFLDNSASQWVLEIPDGSGYYTSPIVQGMNDAAWKTARFSIKVLPDATTSQENCDFRLRVTNEEDVTVKFVRVMRGSSAVAVLPSEQLKAGKARWHVRMHAGNLCINASGTDDFHVTLSSVTGRNRPLILKGKRNMIISLKGYPQGVYVVRLHDRHTRFVMPVLAGL